MTRRAWRRPFRGGMTCSTRLENSRAPTRSLCRAAASASTAATSAARPALVRGSPKRVEPEWSTTSRTVSSRSSVNVLTKGLPSRAETFQSMVR